jgi:hypothetical protein
MNQMERPSSINHSISNQTFDKTEQLAVVCASKREEITARDVSGIEKARWVHMLPLKQRYNVWPKCMSAQFPK